MAFYPFDGEGKPLGRILRTGLDNLRDGIYKLARINDDLQQMTDAQAVTAIGFPDTTVAAAAKAELASDVGKLLTDDSQSNVRASLVQMFAQFG